MNKNKYFAVAAAKLNLAFKHFRFIVFIFFIVFLFYMLMLSVRISAAIGHIPSPGDIDKKIPAVKIRKDVIDRINKLIYIRQEGSRNRSIGHNPFLPYQKSAGDSLGETVNPAISSTAIPDNSAGDIINDLQP